MLWTRNRPNIKQRSRKKRNWILWGRDVIRWVTTMKNNDNKNKSFPLTSSGTFSHSPFTFSSPSFSFLAGFCLSFLLNEILRKDHFFLTFFGFLLLSSADLLSFSVSSALPFSCVLLAASESDSAAFSVVGELALAAALASPAPPVVVVLSFSVLASFSFSAASVSTFFSYFLGIPAGHAYGAGRRKITQFHSRWVTNMDRF